MARGCLCPRRWAPGFILITACFRRCAASTWSWSRNTVAIEEQAFDIGTGTGVLSALFAQRGVSRVIATDKDPGALACASENIKRLGFDHQVEVVKC